VWSVVQIHSSRPNLFLFAVPLILLTNDDGIEAEGLRSIEDAIKDLADILVVAPDSERSAVSHGLTIHSPLELEESSKDHYALNGTPADCIIFALNRVTAQTPPNLIISGINHGANLGDDIMYSGTVAAAREGSRHGIPSLAVSQAVDEKAIHFKSGAKFVRKLVEIMLVQKMRGGICLNVNIPVGRIRGIKITRQGCSFHFPHFNFLEITEDHAPSPAVEEYQKKSALPLDFQAIMQNFISITPLQRDQTDYTAARALLKEEPRLSPGFRIPGLGLIG
jgi:5'-nucleotidase